MKRQFFHDIETQLRTLVGCERGDYGINADAFESDMVSAVLKVRKALPQDLCIPVLATWEPTFEELKKAGEALNDDQALSFLEDLKKELRR